MFFLIIKIIHIISIISFMAGMLYLPRLFVYHSIEESSKTKTSKTFEIMEKNLLKYIINPAMIFSLISGSILSYFYLRISIENNLWIICKFILFLFLGLFHMFCSIYRKKFLNSTNFKTTKFFRIFNEIPTIIMIIMVILVIIKPF
jgi:putative membrane protein